MNKFPYEKIKREVIIRKGSKTNPDYGCDPDKRTTEEIINYGIVNIDKPPGPTSHQVSAFVKKILNVKKSGHSGTLDPNVTGVLVVSLEGATRTTQLLLKAGKEYIALMHLHKEVDEKIIRQACNNLIGEIRQLPPIKSSVRRRYRKKTIYYLDIIEIDGKDVLFRVGCQAGTYIRKLIHDLGQTLKVGAHMAQLRRTRVGPFDESTTITLHDLTDAFHYYKEGNDKYLRHCIQPVEKAIQHIPKIWILDSAVDSLCNGASLSNPGISKMESGIEPKSLAAILTLKNELVAYGQTILGSQQMLEEKGLAVKTQKVFMKPGTYPKLSQSPDSSDNQ